LKKDLDSAITDRMESWDADLKVDGPHKDRLKKLISGDNEDLDQIYGLADLSVLRDRFLSTYQHLEQNYIQTVPPPQPSLTMSRASSEPPRSGSSHIPTRVELLRATSGTLEPRELKLLEMAHEFQEKLENNGKTEVSIWQLNMHFTRFAEDPLGALLHCSALCNESAKRSPEERQMKKTSTFSFLRQLGLEQYAFALEDKGFKFWADLKSLSKEDIEKHGKMSELEAKICHAVLTNDTARYDLLRLFHKPEFQDVMEFFSEWFPQSSALEARKFAVELTDALGQTEFSCFQIQSYLREAKGPVEAINGLEEGLVTLKKAEMSRKRPEEKLAVEENQTTSWVGGWLESIGLQTYTCKFTEQAIETREDLLGAPIDHGTLQEMGVQKIGDRCKIMRAVAKERG